MSKGKGRGLFFLYMLILLSTALESFGIASLYPVVDILQDSDQLSLYQNRFFSWIPTLEPSLGGGRFTAFLLIGVGSLFLLKNVFGVLAQHFINKISTRLHCSWIDKIFTSYMGRSYSFFVEHQAGDLVQRQLMQTEKAASALREFIRLCAGLTTILALYLVMLYTAFKITLLMTLLFLPVYYLTSLISKGPIYHSGERIVEIQKEAFSLSTEVISGIRQVKVFLAEDFFTHRLRSMWDEFARHQIRNMLLATLPRPTMETLVVLLGLGGAYVLIGNEKSGGVFMPVAAVFGAALYRMLPLIAGASNQTMNIAALVPSAERVAALLEEKTPRAGGIPVASLQTSIVFEKVSFGYNSRDLVLSEVSLTFEQNRFYGIVGSSGGGKSTIIDLLSGFYTPQKGRVLVDGMDLRDVDIRSWFAQLGVISQENFLFSGTIEDNICFGVEELDRDEARMEDSARVAFAHDFIKELPQGYKTPVGERGVKLSGGQRQRLAIARAIYLNPPVLIFDEATSALDPISEKRVQEAIENLHGKRTLIAVAHRLSTIANADHIYVVENGRLIEQGDHQSLRMNNGFYSQLYASQVIQ